MALDPARTAFLFLQLEAALFTREIATGFCLLDETFPDGEAPAWIRPVPTALLLCVAQWVDLGYRDPAFLDRLGVLHVTTGPAHLTLVDYVKRCR